jgi:hypothetical protein
LRKKTKVPDFSTAAQESWEESRCMFGKEKRWGWIQNYFDVFVKYLQFTYDTLVLKN